MVKCIFHQPLKQIGCTVVFNIWSQHWSIHILDTVGISILNECDFFEETFLTKPYAKANIVFNCRAMRWKVSYLSAPPTTLYWFIRAWFISFWNVTLSCQPAVTLLKTQQSPVRNIPINHREQILRMSEAQNVGNHSIGHRQVDQHG